MKKILLYALLLPFGFVAASCNEDSLSSTSVITGSVNVETEFDTWLEDNYRAPYNISFLYRYEDIETDMDFDLAPAKEIYSRIMAKMVRFLWLDAYTEVTDIHFMRQNSPRMMQVIGSAAFNQNNTFQLGTAEGGQKITLYVGNWLVDYLDIIYEDPTDESKGYKVVITDVDMVNYYYLHTIHHEFAHILNQKIDYPRDYNTISQNDYVAAWNNLQEAEAAQMGFVSPYAASAPGEDFVEVFAFYLTWSEAEWQAKLTQAGATGADRIERKLTLVKNYMEENWNIDMDELRDVLARRYAEIENLNWSDFNTEE